MLRLFFRRVFFFNIIILGLTFENVDQKVQKIPFFLIF